MAHRDDEVPNEATGQFIMEIPGKFDVPTGDHTGHYPQQPCLHRRRAHRRGTKHGVANLSGARHGRFPRRRTQRRRRRSGEQHVYRKGAAATGVTATADGWPAGTQGSS